MRDIHMTLDCTLLEFMQGCFKEVAYTRQILNADGKTTSEREVKKRIEVKPGYSSDTVLTFEKEGDEEYAQCVSDLVVSFNEVSDDSRTYKRVGDDIHMIHRVSLKDALLALPVVVKNLDGEDIKVVIDEMITPQT